MKRISTLLIIFCLILLAGNAYAEQSLKGKGYSLTAKTFEYNLESNELDATGNAKLTMPTGHIAAETIHARLTKDNQQLQNAEASGSVKISIKSANGVSIQAFSQKAILDQALQTLNMTGKVRVSVLDKSQKTPSRLTGDTAVIKTLASGDWSLKTDGDASLSSEQGSLKADHIEAALNQKTHALEDVFATGSVHAIIHQSGARTVDATCNQAQLLSSQNRAILTGNVSITVIDPSFVEPAHLSGEKATILLVSPRKIIMEGDGTPTVLQIHPKTHEKR